MARKLTDKQRIMGLEEVLSRLFALASDKNVAKEKRASAMDAMLGILFGQHFVYAIENDQGHIKIGYSSDPQKRLSGLQQANSGALNLIGARRTFHPSSFEDFLHTIFAKRRLQGEWFDLDERARLVLGSVMNGRSKLADHVFGPCPPAGLADG